MASDHHHHHEHHHGHDHGHDHHGHAHGHGHAHSHALASFGTAFAVGAALNIALIIGQVGYGLAVNSVALLADAAHNFGDVLALFLAWGAAILAQRRPSARRTYGWGRFTIGSALISAMMLLVSAGVIGLETIERFANPAPVGGVTVMVVAGVGIVVNGFTAWLFSRGHDDLNIRATFQHMAADALVSLGVVVAAGGILLTGWQWLDPAASLLIVVIIIIGTWGTLRDAAHLAMDGVPAGIAPAEVAAHLRALPGVADVHDLHIWALSTTQTALTAHLVREPGADDQALLQQACRELDARFAIQHSTIQVETTESAASCRLRPEEVI
jgi:cobalt-zinc-cadmium efflux system protein